LLNRPVPIIEAFRLLPMKYYFVKQVQLSDIIIVGFAVLITCLIIGNKYLQHDISSID
jgi:hypothetical protein